MARKKAYRNYYPRVRVHHIVIFMLNKDGSIYMTEEQLQQCLAAHEGGYATYSYILHDSDEYDTEAVYQNREKNHKTYIERLRLLSDAQGLSPDETAESGFAADPELEAKAKDYADQWFPPIQAHDKKPAHWHVILTFSNARGLDEIARWFKGIDGKVLEPNWVEGKTGRGAAESAWLYLVHAHHKQKHQYDPARVVSSFDYANSIQEQLDAEERHEKYHVEEDIVNDVLEEVCHGLPLKEAAAKLSRAVYLKREPLLLRARAWYVANEMPMPAHRQVYYVESDGIDRDHGRGGLGKTACSHALAKQIAKQYGADTSKAVSELSEYIYIAGDPDVFLQNYDGQPILLINEINGTDLKRACKGINGVKELLDPFPEKKELNKKYGSVVCAAKYIIMNGIQSFNAFIESLAKSDKIDGYMQESESGVKEQFNRRIWAVIKLLQESVSIMNSNYMELKINQGLFDNTPEQSLLTTVGYFRANFKTIKSGTCGEAQAALEAKALTPLLERIGKAEETHAKKQKVSKPEELSEELLAMGEQVSLAEVYGIEPQPEPKPEPEPEQLTVEQSRYCYECDYKKIDWDDEEGIPF